MRRYEFGDFSLDVDQQRLTKSNGGFVGLTPRLFDALRFFVEHPGELLDKEQLLTALWPGLIVEENSLSQTISALRRALGDEVQDSRYIQTIPRRGFRFIAPVTFREATGVARRSTLWSPTESRRYRHCLRLPRQRRLSSDRRRKFCHPRFPSTGDAWFGGARPAPCLSSRPVLQPGGGVAIMACRQRRHRPLWPSYPSSRWWRRRVTNCWRWGWPTAWSRGCRPCRA